MIKLLPFQVTCPTSGANSLQLASRRNERSTSLTKAPPRFTRIKAKHTSLWSRAPPPQEYARLRAPQVEGLRAKLFRRGFRLGGFGGWLWCWWIWQWIVQHGCLLIRKAPPRAHPSNSDAKHTSQMITLSSGAGNQAGKTRRTSFGRRFSTLPPAERGPTKLPSRCEGRRHFDSIDVFEASQGGQKRGSGSV